MTKEIIESVLLMLILAMTTRNLFYLWDIWKICKEAEKDLKLRNKKKRLLYQDAAYKNLAKELSKED